MARSPVPLQPAVRLGRRLAALRQAHGLTKVEAARRAGISRLYYRGIEGGTRNATLAMLHRLSSAFGVTLHDLLCGERPADAIDDPQAVRFADLFDRLDPGARTAVLQVMERFAGYGPRRSR